jgi:hypothetical protein
MTACSTPSNARHTLAFDTPFSVLWFPALDKPET